MPAAIPISSMPTPYSTPLPLPRPHIATHSFHSHLLQYMPAARFVCAGLCRLQRPKERGMPAACPHPVCEGAQRARPRRKPAGTPGKCPEPGPAAHAGLRPRRRPARTTTGERVICGPAPHDRGPFHFASILHCFFTENRVSYFAGGVVLHGTETLFQ